ncbi:MAG: ATP-binding cassette domain-containing protein [Actinomycetia bacterium]|nr:ATP-binding cassette domain-containing protein [Actinomycetes bacterium]
MTAPVLHMEGVTYRNSPRFELRVPSLTIGAGVTVVLGNNGCGKTTLLRLLATVTAPSEGTLVVGGEAVVDRSLANVRRRLGYLPQDDSVPRRLSVFDHVDLIAVMRELAPNPRARRGHVHRALRDVDLVDLASERCGRLSGGQRRRVALAAALAGRADVLVLDEPDAHLDDEQLGRLSRTLADRATTTTIVVATHDRRWADEIADRTIELVDGLIAS